jgi:hypothetical protein
MLKRVAKCHQIFKAINGTAPDGNLFCGGVKKSDTKPLKPLKVRHLKGTCFVSVLKRVA